MIGDEAEAQAWTSQRKALPPGRGMCGAAGALSEPLTELPCRDTRPEQRDEQPGGERPEACSSILVSMQLSAVCKGPQALPTPHLSDTVSSNPAAPASHLSP